MNIDSLSCLNAKGSPKVIRAFRLLKIVMKRKWRKKQSFILKNLCKYIIISNEIDYKTQNIPIDLKEYLSKE